jgi:hypothetical protein
LGGDSAFPVCFFWFRADAAGATLRFAEGD